MKGARRMDLDTSKAWSAASATVSANKEVLVAIAGVFFFLPSLALALFFPQPEPPAGAEPKQLLEIMGAFYRQIAPYMALATLVQVLGQLSVLTLTARAGRATVGDAIRAAVGGLLPYLGAQLVVVLAAMASLGVLAMLAALSKVLAVVLGLLALIAAVWAALRLSLVPVVIAVEGQRNPLAVLRRSWRLTDGNAGRILLFVLVLALAVMVISVVASAGVGIVLALVGGAETARIGGAAISALVGAGFTVYTTICFAAIHGQLAGTASIDEAVFD